MPEFDLIGIASIALLLIFLIVICGIFLIRSENISYNPCFYNSFKDEYRQFIITGLLHSFGVSILTVLQILSHNFSEQIALHINGSLQIISLVPILVYYHSLVMNYQYRYMDVRNRASADFEKTYCVEVFSVVAFIAVAGYAILLFVAETSFPHGIYSDGRNMDPHLAWTMENYVVVGYALTGIGSALLIIDFVRIARLTARIRKTDIESIDSTRYQFQNYISKFIEPHYFCDFFTLYLPIQYQFLRVFPVMNVNEIDVVAKGLIIAHPIVFIVIYMIQIHLATRKVDRAELECECFVCVRKKNRVDGVWQFISRNVMKLNVRNRTNEGLEGDGSKHPNETTPAMHSGRNELFTDSAI